VKNKKLTTVSPTDMVIFAGEYFNPPAPTNIVTLAAKVEVAIEIKKSIKF